MLAWSQLDLHFMWKTVPGWLEDFIYFPEELMYSQNSQAFFVNIVP